MDRMERKGHVDAQMSGVREFEDAQSGWAQAQAIMTRPHQVPRDGSVIQALRGRCGGWRVMMTVKCSPAEGETGRACQRRSAGG